MFELAYFIFKIVIIKNFMNFCFIFLKEKSNYILSKRRFQTFLHEFFTCVVEYTVSFTGKRHGDWREAR